MVSLWVKKHASSSCRQGFLRKYPPPNSPPPPTPHHPHLPMLAGLGVLHLVLAPLDGMARRSASNIDCRMVGWFGSDPQKILSATPVSGSSTEYPGPDVSCKRGSVPRPWRNSCIPRGNIKNRTGLGVQTGVQYVCLHLLNV